MSESGETPAERRAQNMGDDRDKVSTTAEEESAGKATPTPGAAPSGRHRLSPRSLAGGVASGAVRLVSATAETSWRVGRAMLRPERLEMMRETGLYLRDVRELAGLTLMELSAALDLEDKSLLEAVENGTATLSFELILRTAALVARHDPVPFVMRVTRTYNPAIWRILHDWGVGRVTLQYERERVFVNMLRRHDAARKLSDEGYAHVLAFTTAAFEMALDYAMKAEGIVDEIVSDEALENPSGAKA